MQTLTYRPHIDGLRAIAVTAVIVYHMNPAWLPGGFLGVDLFFVISGYLIASIIITDVQNGSFRFRKFYERRARRILPAIILVLVASLLASYVLLDPYEFVEFSKSLLATVFFYSNFLFWLKSGYFADPSEFIPLLHTWSLSVEEQFYIVFPVFLVFVWRRHRRYVLLSLAALFILSLAAATWMVARSESAAFYLLPFRAWELLSGAALAAAGLPHRNNLRPLQAGTIAILAGCAIAVSFVCFSAFTPHPSIYTLPLVVGTCAVIAVGQHTFMARPLESRFLVHIGKLSYSLYLWHWPLIVFGRMYYPSGLPTAFLLSVPFITYGLSYLSWRFVEQPFRANTFLPTRRFVASAVAGSLIVTAAAVAVIRTGGFPDRSNYPESVEASIARESTAGTCFDTPLAHETQGEWFCEIGATTEGPISFIVAGDSHAFSVLPAFREVAKAANVRAVAVALSGCPLLIDFHPVRPPSTDKDCGKLSRRVLELAAEERPSFIVFVARWTYYTHFRQLVRDPETGDIPEERDRRLRLLETGLKESAKLYSSLDVPVLLVGQVPMQNMTPRAAYKAIYHFGRASLARLENISVALREHGRLQSEVSEILAATPEAVFIDPTPWLCGTEVCPIGDLDRSYYFDADHLSLVGALKLAAPLIRRIEEFSSSGSARPGQEVEIDAAAR